MPTQEVLDLGLPKRRKASRKSRNTLAAVFEVLRDPRVVESIDSALEYQRRKAAERSFAGRVKTVFNTVSDPRALVLAETVAEIARRIMYRKGG